MKFIALILEVMLDSIEDSFKRDLFERCERNKKYLIPKYVYYTMLEYEALFGSRTKVGFTSTSIRGY